MKRSVLSCLAAMLCAVMLLPLCTFPAAGESEPGDVNNDGVVDAADVHLLLDYLSGESDQLPFNSGYFADMDDDGKLDARDLTLLKRAAFRAEALREAEPIPAPISVLKPSMPSTGDVRLLLVMVEFWDCRFADPMPEYALKDRVFADAAENAPVPYPMESVRAYYERASYGRLHIDGDVYKCSLNRSISSFADNPNALAEAVFSALDEQIDYRNYDADGDGRMDAVILSVPESAPNPAWWPYSIPYNGWMRYDEMYPGDLCIGNTSMSVQAEYNSTWMHELGHAMGLPDYYFYENVDDNNYYGFKGDAGWELMDKAQCDFCAFSKLMLGWYTAEEVQIYDGGTKTYLLRDSAEKPSCLVIPRGDADGFLNEFFILDYVTPSGNNTYFFVDNGTYIPFSTSGIRVMHCDATVVDTPYRTKELKWNNYGQYYDSSNLRQRIARLANNDEGGYFYGNGDQIDSRVSGFHWYDENGFQTVDPCISIYVERGKGGMRVTVTDSTEG